MVPPLIWENFQGLQGPKSLLLASLEIGFRHLDFQYPGIETGLIHTEHHRELVGVVFESQKSEVITDLLQAWTRYPGYALLGLCAEPLLAFPTWCNPPQGCDDSLYALPSSLVI